MKKLGKMKKNIKGITLVSLVVTIIILLILAGVTINILYNGGIIEKSKEATKAHKLASIKESMSLEILAESMDAIKQGNSGVSKEKLNEIAGKYGKVDGDIVHTEVGDINIKDIIEGIDETNKDSESEEKVAEGTAEAKDVLEGKTFSSKSGIGISGTMPNRGALNWSDVNAELEIPAGYYSGGTLDSTLSYNERSSYI